MSKENLKICKTYGPVFLSEEMVKALSEDMVKTEISKENLKNYKAYGPVYISDEMVKTEIVKVVNQLKEARLFRGLTMAQVCRDLKIPQSTLSKDEKGGKNISVAKLIKYSAYYQVQIII